MFYKMFGKYMEILDKKYKIDIFLFLLLSFGLAFFQIMYPKTIEWILQGYEFFDKDLIILFWLVVGICFLGTINSYAADILSRYICINLSISFKNRILDKIFHMDMLDGYNFKPGEITQTYNNDVDSVANYIANILGAIIVNICTLSGIVVVSLITNFGLGCIITIIALIAFGSLYVVNKYATPLWGEHKKNTEDFYTLIYEVMCLTKEMFFLNNDTYIDKKLNSEINRLCKSNFKATIMGYHLWVVSILCFSVTKWIVILIGGLMVYWNRMDVSTVFLFSFYLDMMSSPIENLRVNMQTIQISDGSLERIRKILYHERIMEYGDNDLNEVRDITFKDVVFSYENQMIFDKFSTQFKAGEIAALIGESGAGKTTLVKLICRLFDVNNGEILINGKNIKCYSKKTLNNNIEYISQTLIVDGLMVKEALGICENNYKMFLDLLKEFELEKYHIRIDESMEHVRMRVSVGDYQTLFAIKTLISHKRILLLDEITSHMDAEREQVYYSKLQGLKKGAIIIFITHKESVMKESDRILKIKSLANNCQ